VKLSDLGIVSGDLPQIVMYAEAGDAEYVKELKKVEEVFIELMKRDVLRRDRIRNGVKVRGVVASNWAVNAEETRTAENAPIVRPAEWMRMVRENFMAIAPTLQFFSEAVDKSHTPPQYLHPQYDEHYARAASNESPRRKRLLEWLKPFLAKTPIKSEWDGEE
jgi:hypothetical protein